MTEQDFFMEDLMDDDVDNTSSVDTEDTDASSSDAAPVQPTASTASATEKKASVPTYQSTVSDDVRKRLLEAYDPSNRKPLFTSMVDALYKPQIKDDKTMRKQGALQTAIGAVADAFASGIESSAGGAPISRRDSASNTVGRIMEMAKNRNDAMREQYARAKMGAEQQDMAIGERAYNASKAAAARYLDSQYKEDLARYNADKDNHDRALKTNQWIANYQQKERDRADRMRYQNARLAIASRAAANRGREEGNSIHYSSEYDGNRLDVYIPKRSANNVDRNMYAIGKKIVGERLKRELAQGGKNIVTNGQLQREMRNYKEEDFIVAGINSPEGADVLRRYGGARESVQAAPPKQPKQETFKAPIQRAPMRQGQMLDKNDEIQSMVMNAVDEYPYASVEDIANMLHHYMGVPAVVDVQGYVRKYKGV